jgi:hypothetical protein
MKRVQYLARVTILALMPAFAMAQTHTGTPADSINERTQLEFCATYLPCALAVGIVDGVAAGEGRLQKLKNYFSGLGRTPAMSSAEFEAFVASQPASWRKEQVIACVKYRGSNTYQEFCEESFLTRDELQQARDARLPVKPVMSRLLAKSRRSSIYERDSNIATSLSLGCGDKMADTTSCDQAIYDFSRLKDEADALNGDPDFLKYSALIELRSERIALQTHEPEDGKWVRRKADRRARDEAIARCDVLRRDTFSAIDDERYQDARTLAQQLRQGCASVDARYADMAQLAESRIATGLAAAAQKTAAQPDALSVLPRRQPGAGSQLINEGLQRAARGEAIDVPGAASTTSETGGGEQVALLAGVLRGLAQSGSIRSGNPIVANMLSTMRPQDSNTIRATAQPAPMSPEPSATPRDQSDHASSSAKASTGSANVTSNSNGSCTQEGAALKRRIAPSVERLGNLKSPVALFEGTMWLAQEYINLNEKFCQGDPNYKSDGAYYKQTYDSALKSCLQLSSNGNCSPRQP